MKDSRLLDGRLVRDRILDEVADRVRQAAAAHAMVASSSVAVYVRGQARAAEKVGLRFEAQTWPSNRPGRMQGAARRDE